MAKHPTHSINSDARIYDQWNLTKTRRAYRGGQKVGGQYIDRFSPEVSNALIRLGEGSLNIGHVNELEKAIGSHEVAELKTTLTQFVKSLAE